MKRLATVTVYEDESMYVEVKVNGSVVRRKLPCTDAFFVMQSLEPAVDRLFEDLRQ